MQCTGVPSLSCRAGRCGCILAVSTAVLFSLLQSLLFRHCDSVAAQHAVSGAHQHAVECSLRDVENMFLQVLVRMCFTMVGCLCPVPATRCLCLVTGSLYCDLCL